MHRAAVVLSCLAAGLAGCAHGDMGTGPLASGESKSSESDESGNSSEQSSDSSQQSGDSSDSSKSEDGSLERSSEESSKESTEDSTDETSSKGEDMNNTTPVLTTAGVLLTGTAVGVVVWLSIDDAPPEQQQVAARTTRQWLVANRHQLALDLGLGAGPALDDLAGAAGIAPRNMKIFGQVLLRHRRELLAITEPAQLTDERALDFLQRVGQIARDKPRLAADYRRFVNNWKKTREPQR